MTSHHRVPDSPLFVAGNLALDFINSSYGEAEEKRDFLTTDAGVIAWLEQAGALLPGARTRSEVGVLAPALAFRKEARILVDSRIADEWADPSVLNSLLAAGSRCTQVDWRRGCAPVLVTLQHQQDPSSLLVPVAEALAGLLADADFAHVRRCGGDSCTLLFQDRTPTHRRRWCDMALCGNRAKVMSFRSRRRI